ncbi:MAG TPA: riboflavin synthase [Oligoflexia bacterium]|nr:riboflavin synthase [Oligoflexia bacterium]HMR24328.1 riboflavin synthase [Oligoflexia bacterium]
MFTGIVQKTVFVQSLQQDKLVLDNPWPQEKLWLGQSIAVNGCCLTVVDFSKDHISFQVSQESLDKTNLKTYAEQKIAVNLEMAMSANSTLDGHMVSGHVDGQCQIQDIKTVEQEYKQVSFTVPKELLDDNMLVSKGSVTLNGVSLTVNHVDNNDFDVMLIPKTLEMTNFNNLNKGTSINIEFDMVGKYIVKSIKPYLEQLKGKM